MALPLGGCLVACVNEGFDLLPREQVSTAHHPLLRLAPFFVLTQTEGIVLWKMNLTTSLVATLPKSKSRVEKCLLLLVHCRQSTSVSKLLNLAQSYASNSLIWNVKHSRADYSLCWNVLTLVAFGKSYTFRIKDRIFPESIESVSTAGKERGFLHSFPHERGGGWTTVEGNGAGRKSYLGRFSVPPLLVVQSSGKLVVSNRRAGSNMKVSVGQAFFGLLSHCCAYEMENRNSENFVLCYLCATQCGCLEGQSYNATHPLMDRQLSSV